MEQNSILTDKEIEALVLSFGTSRGKDQGFTEEEMMLVIRWAEEVSIGQALLANVLQGTVSVDVRDGEVVFDITDKGKQEVEHDMLFNHPNPQTDKIQ